MPKEQEDATSVVTAYLRLHGPATPAAVLVDGEIVGIWRTKSAAKRLKIDVTPFGRLTKATLAVIDDKAVLVARARGVGEVTVRVAST